MKLFNFLLLVFIFPSQSVAEWGGPKEGERKFCYNYSDCHIRDVCWIDHVCWTLREIWDGTAPQPEY
ncbi:hypothetical protein L5515_019080 [Caenorhabditis briggsae]|uniref:Uncharacterized protein n=1 Tax=Caenorhabditis briggsae TaxID=6238 RepID=A0AAE8ZR66_CAEBR|nr:hypothetical protein L3Y34_013232 [Caenorhabditis briggsae]UMM43663.1 hypothetical protein L5515_019080 [Caenorhabditis briggsae]